LDTKLFLDRLTILFQDELRDNLIGIYLHGSLAMGCYNPHKSDIDFLVVVNEKLTPVNNSRIAKLALSLHDEMSNERGIEFTIILETYLKKFVYPTPFEFHYSEYHREKYRTNENYLCGGFEDEDLASQIVVAYERGLTLYGKPLSALYEPIDSKYYIASILHDVEGAAEEIISNPPEYLTPMYLTLNLCRVLYYIKEGIISSKREGGEWGLKNLPHKYQLLIEQCLNEYNGETGNSEYISQDFFEFNEFMIKEIKQDISYSKGCKSSTR
jgi:predicted nucleotidyltransferase